MFNLLTLLTVFLTIQSPAEIPVFEQPPVIDGKMESVWQQGVVYNEYFQEIQPVFDAEQKENTEIYMGHDTENLYILFKSNQDTSSFIEKKCVRDEQVGQDAVGFLIDPMGNLQEEYLVIIGLSGSIMDLRKVLSKGGLNEDMTWDSDIEYAVGKNEDGYTVEIRLPFSNFRRSGGNEMKWNMNFFRRIEHSKSQGIMFPIEDLVSDAELKSLRPFRIRDIEISREKTDIVPYGIYGAEVNGITDTYGNAGVDVKIPVSTTGVVNLAFNPDFSQLEGDPLKADFNNEYALYYSEYRPFFIEERAVFRSDKEIYYSRAIQNPYLAGRYTYKDKSNQAGAIIAYDQHDSNIGNTNAYAGILRYRHKFEKNSMGTMFSIRRDNDSLYNNAVFSVDGQAYMPGNIRLDYSAGQSYIDDDSITLGYYYDAYMSYGSNAWNAIIHLGGMSPDFYNDLGYITRKNKHYFGGYIGRSFYFDSKIIQRITIADDFGSYAKWDRPQEFIMEASDSVDYFSNTKINVYFLRASMAQTSFNYMKKRVNGYSDMVTAYNFHQYFNIFFTDQISADMTLKKGYEIDFNYGRAGIVNLGVANVYYNPIPQLKFNAGAYAGNHLSNPETNPQSPSEINDPSQQWFAYTADAGVSYNPVNELSFKFVAERVNVDFTEGYYPESMFVNDTGSSNVVSREDRLFSIIEYKPSPGNNIYFGMRYRIRNENQIRDMSKVKTIFFKFTSKFQI
ncbi:MAG: hypothetical protein R6U31_02995 [bacterium]